MFAKSLLYFIACISCSTCRTPRPQGSLPSGNPCRNLANSPFAVGDKCDYEKGFCVPFFLCPIAGEQVKQFHKHYFHICSVSSGQEIICCPRGEIRIRTSTLPPPSTQNLGRPLSARVTPYAPRAATKAHANYGRPLTQNTRTMVSPPLYRPSSGRTEYLGGQQSRIFYVRRYYWVENVPYLILC